MTVWLNRNTIALMALNMFRGIGVGGMQALFSLYMASLGYTMKAIGGVITVASIFAALSLPLVGALIDHYGPRKITALTSILIAGSLGILSMQPSLAVFGLSYFLFMLSFFYGQPARMAFLANSVPGTVLGTGVGAVSAVFSASRIAGPTLGGFSAGRLGFQETFLILSILSLVGTVLFLILSREEAKRQEHDPLLERIKKSYYEALRPRREYRRLFAIITVDRLAWGMWLPLLSAHLYKNGFSEVEVGLLMSLQGLVTTLTLPLVGILVDKIHARMGMALSELFGIMSALMLGSMGSRIEAVAAMILLGLAVSTWIPSYNVVIARAAKGNSSLGGLYAQANTYRSIASSVSPYAGGTLYDIVGSMGVFSVSAVMMLALVVLIASGRIGED